MYSNGGKSMPRFIDLSQEIYQGMYVYPGHQKTVIWEHHSHEETAKNFEGGFSYQSRGLLMSDHGPTHVDALSHLDPRPEAPRLRRCPSTFSMVMLPASMSPTRNHAPLSMLPTSMRLSPSLLLMSAKVISCSSIRAPSIGFMAQRSISASILV